MCATHVRKYVTKKRAKSIYEQAKKEWGEQEEGKLEKLKEDLGRLKELLEELPEGGAKEISLDCTEDTYGPSHPPEEGQRAKRRAQRKRPPVTECGC